MNCINKFFEDLLPVVYRQKIFLLPVTALPCIALFSKNITFLEGKKGFKKNRIEEKIKTPFFWLEEKQGIDIDAKTGKFSKMKRGERNCS